LVIFAIGSECRPSRRPSPNGRRELPELFPAARSAYTLIDGVGITSFDFDFHERDVPPSSEDLAAAWRQYIEPCIEAFGVNRCMFESNFPPDKQSGGYTELWNAFKRITAGACRRLKRRRSTAALRRGCTA
jgi:hypothetical protein